MPTFLTQYNYDIAICIDIRTLLEFVSLFHCDNIRSPKAIVHTLASREILNYTWDDPEGKKMIRWNFPSAIKIRNRKPIEIVKVI